MATRKPLVLISGQVQRLPDGDDISGASATLSASATNNHASPITQGQAVYVFGAGSVDLAQANALGTAKALGLVQGASIAAAAAGAIQYGGVLSSADWTAVTGATALTPGARYFLSADDPGQLTETAPDASGQYVVGVGLALNATDLLIEIERPIGA